MSDVNFIAHLKGAFYKFVDDDPITPVHRSLYLAFFELWNRLRFAERFTVSRSSVMELAKIRSKTTYHRILKDLVALGYLKYYPSKNPIRGSQIQMANLETYVSQNVAKAVPKVGQNMAPLNKHVNTKKTTINGQRPESELVVKEFFNKKKWPAKEAQRFFYYYESIDWRLNGKAKITNWHACAQSWMLKGEEIKKWQTKNKQSQSWNNLHTTKDKDYSQPL